jgi:hypothetical protein
MISSPPPPRPLASAHTIELFYHAHATRIRAGMVVTMFGAVMAMPLGATVAYFIKRIEGFTGPLTMLQIMGAVGMAVLTFFPAMWWLIALFRLDRDPQITRTLSDAGWLQWVGGLTIYYPTIITMAIASFIDKSVRPALPRWFGYLNLWLVALLLPGQLIFFFKSGPFAWDGLAANGQPRRRVASRSTGRGMCISAFSMISGNRDTRLMSFSVM